MVENAVLGVSIMFGSAETAWLRQHLCAYMPSGI